MVTVARITAHASAMHLGQGVQQIKQEQACPFVKSGAALSNAFHRRCQEREALDDVKCPRLRLRRPR